MPSLSTPPILSPYLGPLRTYLSGDIEGAQQRVGLARLLVGQLHHRLALGGITSGRDAATFPDGTVILAEVGGGLYQVQIHVPILGEEEGGTKFPYLSGLHEIVRVFASPEGDSPPKYATQFYPSFRVGKQDRAWYQLNVGFFDNQPWPLTPELLPDRTRNTPLTSFLWNWVNRALPELRIFYWKLADFPFWPSRYTGSIRRVIQKQLGRRLRNPFHLNCGLYTPDPNQPAIDQLRWIIEIVPEGPGAGVFAYPIRFFNELDLLTTNQAKEVRDSGDTDRYDYGLERSFVPPSQIETSVDAVLTSRGRSKLRLASASTVSQLYENNRTTMTPWYPNWAFSYSGHEAQIVLFEIKEIGGYPAYYTTRFKMTLKADERGQPSSADFDVMDEGWVKAGPLTYQLFAPILEPVQEQVFWDSAATVPDFDSPLYVFYDRRGAEVVLRIALQADVAVPDVHLTAFDCTTLGEVIGAGWCPSPVSAITAELCNVGQILDITNKHQNTLCFYCERTFPIVYNSSYSIYNRVRWIGGAQGETDWNVQCNLSFLQYVYVKGTYIELFQSEDTGHAEVLSFTNRITLPLYEREGFFHYQVPSRTATGPYIHRDQSSTPPYSAVSWHTQKSEDGTLRSVSAPYTQGGDYNVLHETAYPANSVFSDHGYRYIGSVYNEENQEDSAVVDLTSENLIDTDFAGEFFAAVAVNEPFSGKWILLPESSRSRSYSVEYPVEQCARYGVEQPVYLCFVGDGTGDTTWGGKDTAKDFDSADPEYPIKRSFSESPIDLYAIGLPKRGVINE